jgi:Uma2 family endonuclease
MTAPAATASPLRRRYRLEEFFALDAPEGGGHYELIAGVLYMVPPPSGPHHLAASRLVRIFSRYCDAHPERCTLFVPRTPIWTPADTYLEPDLLLIQTERLREMDAGRLSTADLVVEILSPASAMYDRTAKADTYAVLGVAELWLVDLESRSIEQRVLSGETWSVRGRFAGGQPVASEVFAGLEVLPQSVFADTCADP